MTRDFGVKTLAAAAVSFWIIWWFCDFHVVAVVDALEESIELASDACSVAVEEGWWSAGGCRWSFRLQSSA
jgi:hypothetical protein